ncbi:MAG: hypothetical protein HYU51_17640 [Candidatus Rokubacteria bacterium]|nr:hypothetical protein [Candidatus Rokubacteria bacterium]
MIDQNGQDPTGSAPRPPGQHPRRGPTILQRAVTCLKTHPGQAFCASCLSSLLGLQPSAGHNVMPKLEGYGIVSVRHDACSRCGRRRLVASTK